jgi:membrane-bound lytic murein transglycosylase B
MPGSWNWKRRLPLCLPALLVLAASSRPAAAVDFREYPEMAAFIQDMSARHGFSPAELRRVFAHARIRPEIIEAIERPREALPWHEYKKNFVTTEHVQLGRKFWQRHEAALERARAQYGVAPEIIVAIIGVETQYGRNKGEYPVIDALTTLMLRYPPRAEFFRRELEEFLLLARESGFDPVTIKGSYAGAMGTPQFIPSSYRRYAVDFNGDRRRDLLNNPEDAIGSVANFLKEHGWQTREPVADEVEIQGTLYFWVEKLGVKPVLSVSHLVLFGVVPREATDTQRLAALIALEGESGPFHRLGYDNFYVITRYNRSKRYAMAVYELGEMIRRQREHSS